MVTPRRDTPLARQRRAAKKLIEELGLVDDWESILDDLRVSVVMYLKSSGVTLRRLGGLRGVPRGTLSRALYSQQRRPSYIGIIRAALGWDDRQMRHWIAQRREQREESNGQ